MIGRDELVKANVRRYKVVPLPIGDVRIQSLSNLEMRSLSNSFVDARGDYNRSRGDRLHELLISCCAVDEQGNRLFTDDDANNGVFDSIDGCVIRTLFAACKRHTGYNSDDDFQLLEDTAKNSQSVPVNSSSSA